MYKLLKIESPDILATEQTLKYKTNAEFWLDVAKKLAITDVAKELNIQYGYSSVNSLFLVFETADSIDPVRFIVRRLVNESYGKSVKVVSNAIEIEHIEDVMSFFLDMTKFVAAFVSFEKEKENSFYGGGINFKTSSDVQWYDGVRSNLLNEVYSSTKHKEPKSSWKGLFLSFLLCLPMLSGCSPILKALIPDLNIETDSSDTTLPQVDPAPLPSEGEFRYLLGDGWEIKIFKGKVILVKYTDTGMLVKDVFNNLDGDK